MNTQEFAKTLTGLPRFTSSYSAGAITVRFQVVHTTDGEFVAAYVGPLTEGNFFVPADLFADDAKKIEQRLAQIKATYVQASTAWPWPTSEKMQPARAWPFPVSTPPAPEPDAAEDALADAHIEENHAAVENALHTQRFAAILALVDSYMPQVCVQPPAAILSMYFDAADVDQLVVFDTYHDDVKVALYRVGDVVGSRVWYHRFDSGWGVSIIDSQHALPYHLCTNAILNIAATVSDGEFSKWLPLNFAELFAAVYKAADL